LAGIRCRYRPGFCGIGAGSRPASRNSQATRVHRNGAIRWRGAEIYLSEAPIGKPVASASEASVLTLLLICLAPQPMDGSMLFF
jgi:hypothetical protein